MMFSEKNSLFSRRAEKNTIRESFDWHEWERLLCQEMLTKNRAFRAGLVKKPIQKPFYDKAEPNLKQGLELPRDSSPKCLIGDFMSSSSNDGNMVSRSNSYIE